MQTLRVACFHVVVRLRSVTRDWGLGIALLVQTLRVACFHVVVRLRSVTRDWGLGIGDWG
ncbi:MAG: hypothetical protein HEQ35_25995 [Gloeotrichia echinulata IR180]